MSDGLLPLISGKSIVTLLFCNGTIFVSAELSTSTCVCIIIPVLYGIYLTTSVEIVGTLESVHFTSISDIFDKLFSLPFISTYVPVNEA